MRTQEHQVVALPTDNGFLLYKCNKTGLWAFKRKNYEGYLPYHLYFLSDEDIKEGDWYIGDNFSANSLFQAKLISPQVRNWNTGGDSKSKKVAATTNPDLWVKKEFDAPDPINPKVKVQGWVGIPKIPTSFIEAYVREQGKIGKVLLEYEDDPDCLPTSEHYAGWSLKLKPDGSVIVHPVKERMYTKEEMLQIFGRFIIEDNMHLPLDIIKTVGDNFKKWFNKYY